MYLLREISACQFTEVVHYYIVYIQPFVAIIFDWKITHKTQTQYNMIWQVASLSFQIFYRYENVGICVYNMIQIPFLFLFI